MNYDPSNRRHYREEAARLGETQAPMELCWRYELSPRTFMFNDAFLMHRLDVKLKEINPQLDIVYDWPTAENGSNMAPAHHVYLVVQRGATRSHDRMRLLMSLQRDTSRVWPTGTPYKPEDAVIDAFKRNCIKRPDEDRAAESIANNAKIEASRTAVRKDMEREKVRDLHRRAKNKKSAHAARHEVRRKQANQHKLTVTVPSAPVETT